MKYTVTINRSGNHHHAVFDSNGDHLMQVCSSGVANILRIDEAPMSVEVIVTDQKPRGTNFTTVQVYDREEWVEKNIYYDYGYVDVKMKSDVESTAAYAPDDTQIDVCGLTLREFIIEVFEFDEYEEFSCDEGECYNYYIYKK